jgi:hypothetical protein
MMSLTLYDNHNISIVKNVCTKLGRADGGKFKKPTRMPAPQYIDLLMSWIQDQLDNEAVFPSKIGTLFAFIGSFMQN